MSGAQPNLALIRAHGALERVPAIVKAGKEEGDAVSGFPARVINHGLIAALASALASNQKQPKAIADAIAGHLGEFPATRPLFPEPPESGKALVVALAEGDDDATLRRATAESLEFLAVLKRFVKAEISSSTSTSTSTPESDADGDPTS